MPRCFLRLALPLARPAIIGGVALALMETLADFGTVQYFAVRTFTTGIYEAWFGLGDRGAASQLAVCLMGLVAVLLALEHVSRGGRRYHPTTSRQPPVRPVSLSGWRAALAFVACAAPVLLGFGVPAGALLALTVEVGDPLDSRRFLPFATSSLVLAGTTAAVAVATAALLAWAARLHPGWPQRLAGRIAGLGYAVPGSVIAVGTLVPLGLLDNAVDGWMRERFGVSTGLLLSGGLAALVFAYLVRFLAIALSAVESGLGRIRPSLRDAARVLGSRAGKRGAAGRGAARPAGAVHGRVARLRRYDEGVAGDLDRPAVRFRYPGGPGPQPCRRRAAGRGEHGRATDRCNRTSSSSCVGAGAATVRHLISRDHEPEKHDFLSLPPLIVLYVVHCTKRNA